MTVSITAPFPEPTPVLSPAANKGQGWLDLGRGVLGKVGGAATAIAQAVAQRWTAGGGSDPAATAPDSLPPAPVYVPPQRRWWINAAIVGLATAVTSATNHFVIHNTAFWGSKANTSGAGLGMNYLYANWVSNLIKGNICHVSSWGSLASSVLGFAVSAVAIDAAFGGMAGTENIVSAVTPIAVATAAAYASKVLCYKSVQRKPFLGGDPEPQASSNQLGSLKNKCIVLGLGVGACFASAISGLYVGSAALASTLYNQFSTTYRKIGKTALYVTPGSRCSRIATVCGLCGIAFAMSALAGATQSFHTDEKKNVARLWDGAMHYLGATSGIAATGLITDQLWRALGRWKAKRMNKVPSFKWGKTCAMSSLFLGEVILATVAHGLNTAYFGASKTLSLGIKLFQQGFGFHSLRGAQKGSEGWKKAGVLTASIVASILPCLVAHYWLDPEKSLFESFSFPATAIALGNVAAFFAKWVRNALLPKPKAASTESTETEPAATAPAEARPVREEPLPALVCALDVPEEGNTAVTA